MVAGMRTLIYWLLLPAVALSATLAAAYSPLLEWRDPAYIIAGFAGIIGLALLAFQPLLATASFPGVSPRHQKQIHKVTGMAIVLTVIIHVTGLWITSPPDVIDALTFSSPTLFTPFGVVAMCAVILTAILFALRKTIRLSPGRWKSLHLALAWLIVPGTVIHALLIEGTMETTTKALLCTAALGILAMVTWRKLADR